MTGKGKSEAHASPSPWSAPVIVAQIPETGLRCEIDASGTERDALAQASGLRDVASAHAVFELLPVQEDGIHVRGRVSARVGQVCVVTLDPIENNVSEDVDLMFVPESRIRDRAPSADGDGDVDAEVADPPEPIVNGIIDLGRVATDALFLGLDPYPRKPDAVFEPLRVETDPEDHPFAALKALKDDPTSAGNKKPKRD